MIASFASFPDKAMFQSEDRLPIKRDKTAEREAAVKRGERAAAVKRMK